ncbi:sigma-70 family RNA polymerase sigma factor [Paludisphaera mucosa]|uniref:Sigma-70 family RNA polymerase sigma factor n=1 Tax=Paludisphaera mucosa TaxID=3030827 RepID=A0ABT6F6A1_9BACT|nr:sigma-70 family RNA polymerase sigma factor [Paludisphaera mucosa]MDG3003044.1 sigma-70 family RNA polymerase sigma factor [Paludisphaera mucosa]
MTTEIETATADADLWRQACAGSREAFEQVVLRHQSLVSGVAFNACGDLATSEDVAQETFWAAWRGRDSLADPTRLRPWLCGIARNLGANAARHAAASRSSKLGKLATDREAPGLDPAEAALREEEKALIWRTLGEVPSLYREPLILYYRQDQSVADVAAALDVSVDAVKQRLARGRALLRDRLADLVEDGLRRTRPGRSFTAGVMAGIGLAGTSAKTAAAFGGTMIRTAAVPVAASGLLGALAGLAGGWLGAWLPAQAAPTLRERDLYLGFGRRMLFVSLGFLAFLLLFIQIGGGTRWYLPTWLAAVVAFQVAVLLDVWRLSRSIRLVRESRVPVDDANRSPMRRGMAYMARRVQGRVYRSDLQLLGLPLIDVQVGDPPAFDRDGVEIEPAAPKRSARGWIAVGDEALGVVLAVGTRAVGGVAIGGTAIGVASFGGVAVGIVGFGGLASGLLAIGGAAFGGIAMGGLAVGELAVGGAAVARRVALGGLAVAWETALGGAAIAHQTAVARDVAAAWLAGGPSGMPELDRPIVQLLRGSLIHARSAGLVLGGAALAIELARATLMYRRKTSGKSRPVPLLLFTGLLGLAGCTSHSQPQRTTPIRLDNGLRVLLRPVSGASQVSVVILYDIGGDHDPEGRSGLAHLVEHVYVTAAAGGAPVRSAEEFFQRYPAGCNAQTGDRYTAFATVALASDLDAELREAAARMGALTITDADLDRERPRLLQEVSAMFDRVPTLAAVNNAREIVRPSPNGGRRGGLPEHVARMTADEVSERWRRYYKPRNAILALAGAVDPTTAKTLIERHFGAIPAGDELPRAGEPGTTPTKHAQIATTTGAGPAISAVAVSAPQPTDPLYADYAVLGARLMTAGMDPTTAVQVHMPLLDDPAAMVASSVARDGEAPEDTTRRVDGWISGLIGKELAAGETTQVASMFGFFLGASDLPDEALGANLYGVAFALGRREQLGIDPARMKAALAGVTASSLRRAASEIFADSRRAAVAILPAPAAR